METKTKAQTFIGFAMRMGKYKIGLNAVQTLKKAYLMIVCSSSSENTKAQAKKIAKALNCPLLVSKLALEEITHKENAKVMAIADKNLAEAIIKNSNDEFVSVD